MLKVLILDHSDARNYTVELAFTKKNKADLSAGLVLGSSILRHKLEHDLA
jgi:hypothetical protein